MVTPRGRVARWGKPMLRKQTVGKNALSHKLLKRKTLARPAGLEPAPFCLEGTQYKTLSAAAGIAYEEARHLSRP